MAEPRLSESPDSLFVPQDDHYDNEHDTQRYRLPPGLALPRRGPTHFVGDGLDFRRPIMSENAAGAGSASGRRSDVIDLTADDDSQHHEGQVNVGQDASLPDRNPRAQRLPRFDRDIIDVESEQEEAHAGTSEHQEPTNDLPVRGDGHSPTLHPRYSVLRRPNRARADPLDVGRFSLLGDDHLPTRSHTPAQRSITPFAGNIMNETIDLTADDDDVVFMEARARPGVNHDRPATAGRGVGAAFADIFERADVARLRQRIDGVLGQATLQLQRQREAFHDLQHQRLRNIGTNNNQRRDDGMPRATLVMQHQPGMVFAMDYATPAFGMGYAGGNEPTQPKYEPPPAAANGFTRSPTEDDVVVCPNCGDELAIGKSDEKQEIWVIKKCGHAYCGDCARNHAKSGRASKKGKGKATVDIHATPDFKQCVVDGCKESVSGKAFMHVFIGS